MKGKARYTQCPITQSITTFISQGLQSPYAFTGQAVEKKLGCVDQQGSMNTASYRATDYFSSELNSGICLDTNSNSNPLKAKFRLQVPRLQKEAINEGILESTQEFRCLR